MAGTSGTRILDFDHVSEGAKKFEVHSHNIQSNVSLNPPFAHPWQVENFYRDIISLGVLHVLQGLKAFWLCLHSTLLGLPRLVYHQALQSLEL